MLPQIDLGGYGGEEVSFVGISFTVKLDIIEKLINPPARSNEEWINPDLIGFLHIVKLWGVSSTECVGTAVKQVKFNNILSDFLAETGWCSPG